MGVDYDRKAVDRPAIALAAAMSVDPVAHLRSLAPRHTVYADLRTALARYRAIAAEGDWPRVPEGETIRPGDASAQLEALRERLAATGDYQGDMATPPGPVYGGAPEEAVRRFQTTHGPAQAGRHGERRGGD